ncbi:MAG: aconitate hydratase AcnA [Phycisphaerae bacterium]|nr:MAG: aconitate hydratase AcnA [Planctomycetota bacterium]KAB2948782.1 MAG: aconitate hydratase AcnA [Phycisphaerae bacterium]MBE7457727.1 aconitate hydratase AcnA [Planctomycetia bacterium]MCK6463753.1 aconitate hydratase AcnA [Phycisphaerae bacterium]MCL4717531.1 aconitate hydratase AcnA [Phycisphaerae bacterium]
MNTSAADSFNVVRPLSSRKGEVSYYSLPALANQNLGDLLRMPFSIKVLLESALRNCDGFTVTPADVRAFAAWRPKAEREDIPFKPARVLMQDFTGVPCVVDLAAMRDAMKKLGGDPRKINPLIPIDLVIDHSVQVDAFGRADALGINADLEFTRNRQRYEFLRWGQNAFDNFRVVPPATGIVHQVNLEYLAQVVIARKVGGKLVAMPDSLVGTDSHTTMINGLGVVGWGVGGIEAEATMLGQPNFMLMPDVVGFKLHGALPEGSTATDLVLRVTEMLRAKGVVGQFVEFYGRGLSSLSLADRATIANMAPEYGATIGFFPVDDETLRYLRMTARPDDLIDLVERYCKEQGLFRTDATPDPHFTDTLELDLSTVEPSLAGPRRPQDRVALSGMKKAWHTALAKNYGRAGASSGGGTAVAEAPREVKISVNGRSSTLKDGSVVIAAITSCTNTSNPSVMVGAGLLARNAVQRGLTVPAHVKTSLAPGSTVVTRYLNDAGLTPHLERLGFHTVGYGCTTCIGNSGPLPESVEKAITEQDLVAAAVLSGNRNFEGRIHSHVKANYLASPPLVVAYAIAGTVNIDLSTQPLGKGSDGRDVYLRDIWPSAKEINDTIAACISPDKFREQYADVFKGSEAWRKITAGSDPTYRWDEKNTYIQNPPFFEGLTREVGRIAPIKGARVLAMLGDSVTTDHISPAGSIKKDSPAGRYLIEHGVQPADFNSYGARRGNDRVMTRGTFANTRIRNLLAPGTEGGVTIYLGTSSFRGNKGDSLPPTGQPASRRDAMPASSLSDDGDSRREALPIFDAAMRYKEADIPTAVLAGKEYGTGSSRDWAAKGTFLLGVRFVLAESFERIHRSNLVGMGVLPLQYKSGETRETLGLTGHEVFDIPDLSDNLKPRQELRVIATDSETGKSKTFTALCRVDTAVEVDYYRNGGILQTVLRQLAK